MEGGSECDGLMTMGETSETFFEDLFVRLGGEGASFFFFFFVCLFEG